MAVSEPHSEAQSASQALSSIASSVGMMRWSSAGASVGGIHPPNRSPAGEGEDPGRGKEAAGRLIGRRRPARFRRRRRSGEGSDGRLDHMPPRCAGLLPGLTHAPISSTFRRRRRMRIRPARRARVKGWRLFSGSQSALPDLPDFWILHGRHQYARPAVAGAAGAPRQASSRRGAPSAPRRRLTGQFTGQSVFCLEAFASVCLPRQAPYIYHQGERHHEVGP
jgi:hypothetical protein